MSGPTKNPTPERTTGATQADTNLTGSNIQDPVQAAEFLEQVRKYEGIGNEAAGAVKRNQAAIPQYQQEAQKAGEAVGPATAAVIGADNAVSLRVVNTYLQVGRLMLLKGNTEAKAELVKAGMSEESWNKAVAALQKHEPDLLKLHDQIWIKDATGKTALTKEVEGQFAKDKTGALSQTDRNSCDIYQRLGKYQAQEIWNREEYSQQKPREFGFSGKVFGAREKTINENRDATAKTLTRLEGDALNKAAEGWSKVELDLRRARELEAAAKQAAEAAKNTAAAKEENLAKENRDAVMAAFAQCQTEGRSISTVGLAAALGKIEDPSLRTIAAMTPLMRGDGAPKEALCEAAARISADAAKDQQAFQKAVEAEAKAVLAVEGVDPTKQAQVLPAYMRNIELLHPIAHATDAKSLTTAVDKLIVAYDPVRQKEIADAAAAAEAARKAEEDRNKQPAVAAAAAKTTVVAASAPQADALRDQVQRDLAAQAHAAQGGKPAQSSGALTSAERTLVAQAVAKEIDPKGWKKLYDDAKRLKDFENEMRTPVTLADSGRDANLRRVMDALDGRVDDPQNQAAAAGALEKARATGGVEAGLGPVHIGWRRGPTFRLGVNSWKDLAHVGKVHTDPTRLDNAPDWMVDGVPGALTDSWKAREAIADKVLNNAYGGELGWRQNLNNAAKDYANAMYCIDHGIKVEKYTKQKQELEEKWGKRGKLQALQETATFLAFGTLPADIANSKVWAQEAQHLAVIKDPTLGQTRERDVGVDMGFIEPQVGTQRGGIGSVRLGVPVQRFRVGTDSHTYNPLYSGHGVPRDQQPQTTPAMTPPPGAPAAQNPGNNPGQATAGGGTVSLSSTGAQPAQATAHVDANGALICPSEIANPVKVPFGKIQGVKQDDVLERAIIRALMQPGSGANYDEKDAKKVLKYAEDVVKEANKHGAAGEAKIAKIEAEAGEKLAVPQVRTAEMVAADVQLVAYMLQNRIVPQVAYEQAQAIEANTGHAFAVGPIKFYGNAQTGTVGMGVQPLKPAEIGMVERGPGNDNPPQQQTTVRRGRMVYNPGTGSVPFQ